MIIEDERDVARLVEFNLKAAGFETFVAGTAADGLALVDGYSPDVVVLDLMLPDRSGYDVCKTIRAQPATADTGVLMLTAKGEAEDRILGLEVGADDYVIKPFAFAELVARLRALTRRAAGPRWASLTWGPVTVDDEHGVRFAGERVILSPREHALLLYLLRRRGDVVPRGDILREVFGYVGDPGTNAIDVHLAHIRRKLAAAPLSIETIRGAGIRVRTGPE